MAKGYTPEQVSEYISRVIGSKIDNENKEKPKETLGLKTQVQQVYAERGNVAAVEVFWELNEKDFGNIFTIEHLMAWIEEVDNNRSRSNKSTERNSDGR